MISMQAGHGYLSAQEHAFWKQWYHRYLHDFVGERLYHDHQACAVYGYAPEHAYARGIRLAGRTALEYCLDVHAQAIAAQVHGYLQRQGLLVIGKSCLQLAQILVGVAQVVEGDTFTPTVARPFQRGAEIFKRCCA
jgi:hypothetical protein